MRHISILIFLACFSLQSRSQTVAKSIFAEYGYTNIPKESVGLYTTFGLTKYRVYADDKFLKFESYQDIPLEEANKIGPTLRSSFVKERSTNEVYVCVAFDTLFIRMKAGEEERASFQQMTETFNSGRKSVYAKGKKKIDIQGFTCNEIFVAGKYSDTISAFVSSQIILDPAIKDFPMYVGNEIAPYGLMLGRNEVIKANMLELRAIKLEINQPRDLSKELMSCHLVTQQQGEAMMKDLLTKMMRLPTITGKN
ncbi:MAG: hypothetical protein H7246_13720 [Phycisphaerae bacterium]|nr:hypothetical protein [Saprospiraceae bacterium]